MLWNYAPVELYFYGFLPLNIMIRVLVLNVVAFLALELFLFFGCFWEAYDVGLVHGLGLLRVLVPLALVRFVQTFE
jgi:hypothetical protein